MPTEPTEPTEPTDPIEPAEPNPAAPAGSDGPDAPAAPAGPGVQAEAVRAVLRRALRDMLVLVAVLAVVGIAVGAWVAGVPGVWGAVIGVVVALVFSGTTVVSMLRTADAPAATTAAVILGAWLVKMIVLVALFAMLRPLDFYDRNVLAVVVVVGVLGSAYLDYRAVTRGRVPYVEPADDGAPKA